SLSERRLARRNATAAHGAGAALPARATGARARLQGSADRRRGRRSVRLLQHLQGSEAAADVVGARSQLTPHRPGQAALSPSSAPAAAVRRVSGGLLSRRAGRSDAPLFLASAALVADLAAQNVLLR